MNLGLLKIFLLVLFFSNQLCSQPLQMNYAKFRLLDKISNKLFDKTISVDVYVMEETDKTFTTDAYIQKIVSSTVAVDSYLQETQSFNFTTDAYIEKNLVLQQV